VHNRIVERQLGLGVKPGFAADDALDRLLDKDLVDAIVNLESENRQASLHSSLDYAQKKIDNLMKRLKNLRD